VNDELERMWKEAFVTYLRQWPMISLEEPWKIRKIVAIVAVQAEHRTCDVR